MLKNFFSKKEHHQEKEELPKEKKKREVTVFREYFELFAEVLVFVFFINSFLLQTYVIPSSSMEDTMLIGDHLLVDKVKYAPALGSIDSFLLPRADITRGSIITFSGPSEIYNHKEPKNLVKRVIALPGDTIRVEGEKVFINGTLSSESYTTQKQGAKMRHAFPPDNPYNWHFEFPAKFRNYVEDTPNGKAFKVPQDHYFCMGDNRNNSFDSRSWGPLPARYIIGTPWRVYWSYEGTAREYQATGVGSKIKDIFKTII
ncbi:MAG: signal peptidase I, partial [bacterium]|nr:signal peptidase I [bacterium]